MPKKAVKKPKVTRKQKIEAAARANSNNEGAGSSNSGLNVTVERLADPVKPDTDRNEYRVIRLPNGLTATLVSYDCNVPMSTDCGGEDEPSNNAENGGPKWYENILKKQKTVTMASCTLCINVGSFSELSHVAGESLVVPEVILEGSKKYPRNKEFLRFISDHNGTRSSSNECERTIFNFRLPEQFIRDGIDRFVNCFVNPVIDRATILNKRTDIGLDYRQNLDRPVCPNGKQHLYSELVPPEHPCIKFREHYLENMCQAPDDKFCKEVLHFRERHYSANRMTVVIEARLPLNTLEEYAIEYFSRIPNNGLPPVDLSNFYYDTCFYKPEFHKMFRMKHKYGMVNHKTLEVTWTMPPAGAWYRSKPHQYLAWILNHKGKGTLHSYLREKMLGTRIRCRISSQGSNFNNNSVWTLFELSIDLTDMGHDDLKAVLDAVFSYISLMKDEGPKRRIFDEIRNIAEAKFRFTRNMRLSGPYTKLCTNMHLYSPADYLTGGVLFFDYDPAAIKECLQLLTPDRANLIIFDNDFEETESVIEDPDDEEAQVYFERQYFSSSVIAEEWLRGWKYAQPLPQFYLPEANPFVADDFTLVSIPETYSQEPVNIFSNEILEVWHKYDAEFRLPECHVCFCYLSPLPLTSPASAAMMDLLTTILEQFLFEELYHADAANLNYEVKSVAGRVETRIDGFSQKLHLLIQTITKYMVECSNLVTEEIFDTAKDSQLKGYHKVFSIPEYLAEDLKLSLLKDVNWTSLDKHTALMNVQFNEFQHFLNHFTDQLFLKCLVQGNMSASDAIENAKKCVQLLHCEAPRSNFVQQFRVNKIPTGLRCCRVKKILPPIHNSGVKNYYQFGESSIGNAVMIDLLNMIVNDHIFQQLRTLEKLNACTCRAIKDDMGLLGYSLTILDCRYYPEGHDHGELAVAWEDEVIEIFRKSLHKLLKDFSDKELLALKKILLNVKQRVKEDLEDQVLNNWAQIVSGEFLFGKHQRELTAIKELRVEDLREGLLRLTVADNSIRKLSIQIVQDTQVDENKTPSPEKENAESKHLYPHRLMYTMQLGTCEEDGDYFITDIEEYKRGLKTPQIAPELTINVFDNAEKLRES